MKARILILLVSLLAIAGALGQSPRPSIPGMTALCYNSTLGWIPLFVSGGGQSVPYGGLRVPLYGQNNGTSYPVPCDTNGNLFAGGAAGGDLSGSYPNPSVVKINGAAVPASKALVGTNGSGQVIDATGTAPGGDLGGTYGAPTVVKINGGAVPTSKALVGTNGSGQVIDATGMAPGGDLGGTYSAPTVVKINNGVAVPSSITGFHGNSTKIQLSDGTGSSGNIPKYDANGNMIDSGIAASNVAGLAPSQTFAGATNTFKAVQATMVGNPTNATLAAGAAISGTGTGYSAPACAGSHKCTGNSGTVTFTTGSTAASTGVVVTITDTNAHTNDPDCVGRLNLSNTPWTEVDTTMSYTTSVWSLYVGSVLAASTAYSFTYNCQGY